MKLATTSLKAHLKRIGKKLSPFKVHIQLYKGKIRGNIMRKIIIFQQLNPESKVVICYLSIYIYIYIYFFFFFNQFGSPILINFFIVPKTGLKDGSKKKKMGAS